jgi:protein ImuB
MVVCVHLPRFELIVAAGGAEALAGRALAIAPALGGEPRVGEVSGAAEGFGVTRGMALGEALARCPELRLVAGDPLGVAREWGRAARALEGIGAALELPRAGLAYFEADGLRGLHGGEEGVIAAARCALGRPVRVGAGPTRFCALAAALEVRSRRAIVVGAGPEARRYLASRPVALLSYRAETAALVEPLTRLGVCTLGELAELGRDAVADRFGEPGALARRLARGEDDPLRARLLEERLEETLELDEASSGPALERVLGVLIDRLLARPERRGRTLRALTLSARLIEGGTWRERVVLREALSDPRRVRLALAPRLALLPAPAAALRLEAERMGPPEGEQGTLLERARAIRRKRLREAVAQARTVAGPEAALRAVCVDPDSRVPERRVVFTPFPG